MTIGSVAGVVRSWRLFAFGGPLSRVLQAVAFADAVCDGVAHGLVGDVRSEIRVSVIRQAAGYLVVGLSPDISSPERVTPPVQIWLKKRASLVELV